MATGIPSLTTPRLILRPFASFDGPDVERLAGAWEVADTTLNIPHPYPEGGAVAWIDTHGATWAAGAGLTLAITLRASPATLVGAISLSIAREHARGELGYWIAAGEWGRGSVVWQRDPDERVDLTQVWPIDGMTRTQRTYGGIFPGEFLDAPMVIEWSWALSGPRSPRPGPVPSPFVRPIPPPAPRP